MERKSLFCLYPPQVNKAEKTVKKIEFTCPHCTSVLRVPGHLAGVSGPCPKCATTITAPKESDELDISRVEEIPATNGSALAAAVTGSGGGAATATATLPPPVKTVHAETVGESVVEAKAPQPEYAPAPPTPEVVREISPLPTQPSQYSLPIDSRPASPGSYAEPVLPEPVAEPLQEQVISVPPPPTQEIARPILPEPVPMLEEAATSPPPYLAPPIEELSESPVEEVIAPPVPDDVVEPDLASITNPTAAELEISENLEQDPILMPEVSTSGIPLEEIPEPPKQEAPKIAIPKTQPIRIKATNTILPPDRDTLELEPTAAPDLPRLDVSLAESDGARDLQKFQQGGAAQIQLPQLGDEGAYSMEDMLVPSGSSDPLAEEPEANAGAIPLPPEDNLDYSPPPEIAIPVVPEEKPFVPPDPVTASALEQQLLQELAATPPSEESAPAAEIQTEASPEVHLEEAVPTETIEPDLALPQEAPILPQAESVPHEQIGVEEEFYQEPRPFIEQPDLHEPEDISPTNEGSIANMLGAVDQEAGNRVASDLGLEPVSRPEGRPSPDYGQSFPVDEPAPALLSPMPPTESGDEMDVFDELLGRSSPGEKVGPSWLVLGSIVVSVGIIASLMGVYVWNSLGGSSGDRVEKNPNEIIGNYNIISSKGDSEKEIEAVKALNLPPPHPLKNEDRKLEGSAGENNKPKGTENPPPKLDGTGSSITLPGDEDRVRISDGSDGPAHQAPSSLGATLNNDTPPQTPEESGALPSTPKIKDAGVEAYNKQIEAGEDSISALDKKIAEMQSDNIDSPLDAPAIQDTPALVRQPDAAALSAPDVDPKKDDSVVDFAAPGAGESALGKSRDVIEKFIKAPDWESRIPYIYQGDSLRPKIEDYYKKWPFSRSDNVSLMYYHMETDKTLGGPYWVYRVTVSDADAGFLFIVREENGKLKVDWEIYSEFQDRHFVRFEDGTIASPHSFRVVLEQKTSYFGTDREGFTDRDDYLCFEVSPPYGSQGEFSKFAFVKKGTPLAAKLNKEIALGSELLAVVVTLDYKKFPHGVRHMIITKWITEGWFQ